MKPETIRRKAYAFKVFYAGKPVSFACDIHLDRQLRRHSGNIAAYSCIMPVLRPLDLICMISAFKRDTLKNMRDTREFVVNLAGADLRS
jgi:hypothetical protein